MTALMLMLNKQRALPAVLKSLRQAHVAAVTIFDSESLGQFLEETDIGEEQSPNPIGSRLTAGKTIVAIQHDHIDFVDIRRKLAENGVDMCDPEVGVMFSMPIAETTMKD
jgi:hypothetical protein